MDNFLSQRECSWGAKGEDPRSATVKSRADREREGGYSVPAELQLDSSNSGDLTLCEATAERGIRVQ